MPCSLKNSKHAANILPKKDAVENFVLQDKKNKQNHDVDLPNVMVSEGTIIFMLHCLTNHTENPFHL